MDTISERDGFVAGGEVRRLTFRFGFQNQRVLTWSSTASFYARLIEFVRGFVCEMRGLFACVILLAVLGCSRQPPSAGAASVQTAFKGTESQVKEFADQAVEAEAKQDYTTAFAHYRDLSINPDLTPEQRNSANAAMLEMGKKLRQAATNGDVNAEKMLEMYRATK